MEQLQQKVDERKIKLNNMNVEIWLAAGVEQNLHLNFPLI